MFDPIAKALVEANADPDIIRRTLGSLIGELQELDWDTELDSLQQFADCPAVVEAFRDMGITLPGRPPVAPVADSTTEVTSLRLANRNTTLRAALLEAIRVLRSERHPQFESSRSGWIPNSRLDRWEALAQSGSE